MTEPLKIANPFGPLGEPRRHGNPAGMAGIEIGWQVNASQAEVVAFGPVSRALRASVEKATGLTLPDIPGCGMIRGGCSAFQHAPNRFFVSHAKKDILAELRTAIDPALGGVVDQTHGKVALHVSGANAATMLQKLVAIDFDLASFRTGHGLATSHHQIFVLIQRAGSQRFHLHVPRSFARSWLAMVLDAGAEYGIEMVEDASRL